MDIQYPKLVITQDESIDGALFNWFHEIESDLHRSILNEKFIPESEHHYGCISYRLTDENPFKEDQYTGLWIEESYERGRNRFNIRLKRIYIDSSKVDDTLVEYLGIKGDDKLDNQSIERLNKFIKKMYIKNEKMKIEKVVEEAYEIILGHQSNDDGLSMDLERNRKEQIIVNDNFIYQDKPCMVVKLNLIQDDKYIISSIYLAIVKDEVGDYICLGYLHDIPWGGDDRIKYSGIPFTIPEDSLNTDSSLLYALKQYALSAEMLDYCFKFKIGEWGLGILRPVPNSATGKLIDVFDYIKKGHWKMEIDSCEYNTIDFSINCCFHNDKVVVKCVWRAYKGDESENYMKGLKNFVHIEYLLVFNPFSKDSFITQLSKHVKSKGEQYINKMINII